MENENLYNENENEIYNLNDWLVSTTFTTQHGNVKWEDLLKAYGEVKKRKEQRQLYLQSEKGKEYNRAKAKAFYQRHKDKILEKRKLQYDTDKDTLLNRSKAYYEAHKDDIKQKQKQKRKSMTQEWREATEK